MADPLRGKSDDIAQVTHELVTYYQHPATTMEQLSKEFPAMRIDVRPTVWCLNGKLYLL